MKAGMKLLIALPIAILTLAAMSATPALADPPIITNLQVQQRDDSPLVDISFDLADDENALIRIIPMLSPAGDGSYTVLCDSLAGDVYTLPGPGKAIVWDPRANFDSFSGEHCRIRLFAQDHPEPPRVNLFRVEGDDLFPLAPSLPDTVGFGQPYTLEWHGEAPIIQGLDMGMVAQMDTVPPIEDGILGYKWRDLNDGCLPGLEDCWHPRLFNEATGDSFSFYGPNHRLTFQNDGSGPGLFQRLLPSGEVNLLITGIDVVQDTVPPTPFDLVVNYDPETYLLDGETDWAHPEDPQVYPYYVQLNDVEQTRHPFTSGDSIPDRCYVVVKALFRDDERDLSLDPSYRMVGVGRVQGVRSNLTGGVHSFATGWSEAPAAPTWEAGFQGWSADTLGFLVGPRTGYSFAMAAVDEHGRRDGTPASIDFVVGFPPCLQCLELLPGDDLPSSFSPDLECYEGQAGHPCFAGEAPEFTIAANGVTPSPDRTYLAPVLGAAYLAIERTPELPAEIVYEVPDPELYYAIACHLYPVSVLVHGLDHPQEVWPQPVNRLLGMRYQVDYACDPLNSILDGGPTDGLDRFTWGETYGYPDLEIDQNSGLWKIRLQIVVPQNLVQMGSANFRLLLQYSQAQGDPVLADQLYDICIRQLGEGQVRVSALDQTDCGLAPVRPARYHLFDSVRPPDYQPAPDETWRDCLPGYPVDQSLPLHPAAMQSHDFGEELTVSFRIVLEEPGGQLVVCPDE